MIKKLLLAASLCLAAVSAQANIRVAILPAVDKKNQVDEAYEVNILQYIATGITLVEGYSAYDRTNLESILDEQKFQRDGLVDPAQIRRIGEMTGASYVLIATMYLYPKDPDVIMVNVVIDDVETAEMVNSAMANIHISNLDVMGEECVNLARKLLRVSGTPAASAHAFVPSSAPASSGAADLGLSVKWATCNLGATRPEESGYYYAWGEISEKTRYSWNTYRLCHGTETSLFRYNCDSQYGYVDGKTVLEPADDAAAVALGGRWRIPTREEWTELRTRCRWTWITLNGVSGYKVTSPETGNSIFLPAAGDCSDESLRREAGVKGYYWSSSLYTDAPRAAWAVSLSAEEVKQPAYNRNFGHPIRPVRR